MSRNIFHKTEYTSTVSFTIYKIIQLYKKNCVYLSVVPPWGSCCEYFRVPWTSPGGPAGWGGTAGLALSSSGRPWWTRPLPGRTSSRRPSTWTSIKINSSLNVSLPLRSVHTKQKQKRKRKFSLMFVAYYYFLIFFDCSFIFFTFPPTFAWSE